MAFKKTIFLIILFGFTILLAEWAVRWSKVYQTYSEKNFGKYESYYGKTMPTWLHVHSPYTLISVPQAEFLYPVKSNALGLINPDIASPKDSLKTRIIILGDSFTQGIGAPYDSTMPRLLENLLHQDGLTNTEIINAGIVGSDVFFERLLLQNIAPSINPDKVLMVLNYSDLSDYIFRGGSSRFLADGTVQFRKAPNIEKYYRKSHLLRAFLHFVMKYDFTLLDFPTQELQYQEAALEIAKEIAITQQWCVQNKISFLCVIHPYPFGWVKHVPEYHVMENIKVALQKNQVPFIDLYADFEPNLNTKNYLHYAWEKDGHFNSNGYLLFSQLLKSKIDHHYPAFFELKKD